MSTHLLAASLLIYMNDAAILAATETQSVQKECVGCVNGRQATCRQLKHIRFSVTLFAYIRSREYHSAGMSLLTIVARRD